MRVVVTIKLDFDSATVDDESLLVDTLGDTASQLIQDLVEPVTMDQDVVLDDSSVEVSRAR